MVHNLTHIHPVVLGSKSTKAWQVCCLTSSKHEKNKKNVFKARGRVFESGSKCRFRLFYCFFYFFEMFRMQLWSCISQKEPCPPSDISPSCKWQVRTKRISWFLRPIRLCLSQLCNFISAPGIYSLARGSI